MQLYVSPTLVRSGLPLAEVTGPFNAIRVVGDAVGPLFYHGQGAGQMPTASAVVADLIDTAVGRTAITFRTLELWSQPQGPRRAARLRQGGGAVLLSGNGQGHPGVLAQIADVFGHYEISIASVLQQEASGRRRRAAGDHDAQDDRRRDAEGLCGNRSDGYGHGARPCGCG